MGPATEIYSIHTCSFVHIYSEEAEAKINEVTSLPKVSYRSLGKPGFEPGFGWLLSLVLIFTLDHILIPFEPVKVTMKF
jgi:hypothetical protein